jgi:metal-responsive CopG/Arc/MetJ family transcriptional regulator
MKTIAITIDEESLAAVDRLARSGGRGGNDGRGTSRSAVVRQALREFLARRARQQREQKDRQVLAEHRSEIAREAAALVKRQARP